MLRKLISIILAPVLCVVVLATMINAFINYERFSTLLAATEDARFSLVAKGVKAGVEANLNLGLQLGGLGTAKDILDRERAFIPEARGVAIFGSDGRILFASGDITGLIHAPPDWLRKSEWSSESAHWRAVGNTLLNPYGLTVGGVAVLFPRESRDQSLAAMKQKLLVSALIGILLTVLPATAGLIWSLRRTRILAAGIAHELRPGSEAKHAEVRAIRDALTQVRTAIGTLDHTVAAGEKTA